MDFEGSYFSEYSDEESGNEKRIPFATQKGRKNIRDIKEAEDLSAATRIANKNEKERIKRIEEIEKKFKKLNSEKYNCLILDYDFDKNIPLVCVHETLVQKLKKHQIEGVKFMWNACYESTEEIKKSDGSGCIIAHCMGLGKTFQVIALIHTLLNHPAVKTWTVLICCPKNTVLNWINEFQMWITPDLGTINVYNPTKFENHSSRLNEIEMWQRNGGVCVINYELFRILLEDDSKSKKQSVKNKKAFYKCLCNPGPDLVICDEGHVLKNEETKLSRIMNQLRTSRRIVLTGTPMQNNLKEYYCMVQFVKPNLLGTRYEFTNMFVNPILNGQYENSLFQDVQLMKQRSYALHKKLLGCVQRFDLSTLKTFLPEKQEYVLSIALTRSQIEMYRFYLDNYSAKGDWKNQSVALFGDYQSLQRIWTHPYTLKLYTDKHREENKIKKNKKRKKLKRDESDEDDDDSSDAGDFHWKYPLSWWVQFTSYNDIQNVTKSGKLIILFKILKECEEKNEKLLVFSGSLYSLKMIEYFLIKINNSKFEDPLLCNMASTWEPERDYLVLTGKTSSEDRNRYCKSFNNKNDTRLRLFLISTKAGGMGINLTAANRAILFDVSWNPSHDIQSIFRIYRIGQTKPCFIYRFVASGTMEEKIYERQVAKQSISFRVIDEKQIARHYTERELLELYQFEPHKKSHVNVTNLKDPLLRKILEEEPNIINGVHEHDSLLQHKEEEELLEIEKDDAWTVYDVKDNNLECLPEDERMMLLHLTPDKFSPEFLRRVLEKKYKYLSPEEVDSMMAELMPKVKNILKQPDFVEVMKKEALLYHTKRKKRSSSTKTTLSHSENVYNQEKNINDTIVIDSSMESLSPQPSATRRIIYSSDSDDSVFRYDIRKKFVRKRCGRKKPLKSWGMRNRKSFGSPDRDSD